MGETGKRKGKGKENKNKKEKENVFSKFIVLSL